MPDELPATKEEFEALVQQRIERYTQEKLIKDVKGIVNGLVTRVEDLDKNVLEFQRRYQQRDQTALEMAERLGILRLEKEDALVLRELIDDRKNMIKRKKFHQTLFGQAVITVGVTIALLTFLLQVYTVFR